MVESSAYFHQYINKHQMSAHGNDLWVCGKASKQWFRQQKDQKGQHYIGTYGQLQVLQIQTVGLFIFPGSGKPSNHQGGGQAKAHAEYIYIKDNVGHIDFGGNGSNP